MEKTIVLKLDKNAAKPVFEIQSENDVSLSCMFDTGADISVWCSGLEYFELCFPSSEKTINKFLIGGFGKGVIEADDYVIPRFCIDGLTFINFHVAVMNTSKFSWDFIFGYYLFGKMDYTIINRSEAAPLLKIIYDKDIYYVNVKYNTTDKREIVDSPYIFAKTDLLNE